MTDTDVIAELTKNDDRINLSTIGLWLRQQPESTLSTVAIQMLRLARSKQFYAERCNNFVILAHSLPEPYRSQAFDVFANGKPSVVVITREMETQP